MFTLNHPSLKTCAGMLLIELMASLVLSFLLMGFLLEMFVANRKNNQYRAALNQVQKNAQTALSILAAEIKSSGYIGCARLTEDFRIPSWAPYSLTHENKLTIEKNTLTIRHAGEVGVSLHSILDDGRTIYAGSERRYSSGDILIISDCKQAEIVLVREVIFKEGSQRITFAQPLHYQFYSHAEINKLEINTYYVAETNRMDVDGKRIVALYVKDIKGRKLELVESVSQLNIEIDERHDHTEVAIHLELFVSPIRKNWYSYVTF